MNEPICDLALGDYLHTWVRIACRDSQRYGCYRLTGLVARYGCNITLFDLLDRLITDCWRWHWQVGDPGTPCNVVFVDQPWHDLGHPAATQP